MNLATTKWFNEMIDDLSGRLTEGFFQSRWDLVETYHYLGTRILEEHDNFKRAGYGEKIFASVQNSLEASGVKLSESSIYRSVQFARKYPDLAMLKEGKNISWGMICKKYLPLEKPKEKDEYQEELKRFINRIEKLPNKFTLDLAIAIAKEVKEKLEYWIKEWE